MQKYQHKTYLPTISAKGMLTVKEICKFITKRRRQEKLKYYGGSWQLNVRSILKLSKNFLKGWIISKANIQK